MLHRLTRSACLIANSSRNIAVPGLGAAVRNTSPCSCILTAPARPTSSSLARTSSLRSSNRYKTTMTASKEHNGEGKASHIAAASAVEGTCDHGGEEWHHRPPYRPPHYLHEDGQEFERKLEASCHCGQVKYFLNATKPLASKYCHCTDCQTMHGAPFQWAAIFHKADVAFEHGVQNLAFYDPPNKKAAHGLPCKVSCANCGSRIMDEGRNMCLLYPALIKFNGNEEIKKGFAPQMHIFYPKRCLDIPDGMPKWSGLDGKSELVPETR